MDEDSISILSLICATFFQKLALRAACYSPDHCTYCNLFYVPLVKKNTTLVLMEFS